MTGAEILALVPAVVGIWIGLWVCRLPDQPNGLAEVKPVPYDIRAEFDETPSWWTARFHSLLLFVDADVVVGETYDIRSFSGETLIHHQEVGYLDCPCHTCRRICAYA